MEVGLFKVIDETVDLNETQAEISLKSLTVLLRRLDFMTIS
jgi:hypothetical protein